MKFTERSNGYYLEDITETEIRFANLAGRPTKSIYDDPNNPKHVYVLWIYDKEVATSLANMNINVKEITDEKNGSVKYSVQLKAYPKMRLNRKTGQNEQVPKVMLRTLESTVRLSAKSFGLVDGSHVSTCDIRFHPWQYDERKPDCVAVIDELWVSIDEGAGEVDETYLSEKYGYEEELPFV